MKCSKCQTENPNDAKFCEECGVKLESVYRSCGTTITPSSKFYKECSQNLGEAKVVLPIDYSQSQSYAPKILADKILTIRCSIDGECKLRLFPNIYHN